jgi:hypothetical protein
VKNGMRRRRLRSATVAKTVFTPATWAMMPANPAPTAIAP